MSDVPETGGADEPGADEPGDAAEPRKNSAWRGFRKPKVQPLSPEAARRQGLITHLAFTLLGGREHAIAFLNAPADAVGGIPLEIATISPAGFEQVERLLRSLNPPAAGH